MAFAFAARQPDLQLRWRRSGASSAAASAAPSAASAAATGDADLPGRLGDPGDGYVPGTAASAASAAAGARARPVRLAIPTARFRAVELGGTDSLSVPLRF